jgi:hypothetical protein
MLMRLDVTHIFSHPLQRTGIQLVEVNTPMLVEILSLMAEAMIL